MLVEDLKVTARLAHIDLDEASLDAALPAFEQMLDYFAAMMAADEDGALREPTVSTSVIGFCVGPQALRPDSMDNHISENNMPSNNNPNSNLTYNSNLDNHNSNNSNSNYRLQNSLLNSAGDVNGRFIVVPNVL